MTLYTNNQDAHKIILDPWGKNGNYGTTPTF
jgi:hypothetical protein